MPELGEKNCDVNGFNEPSMAREALFCHPWQNITGKQTGILRFSNFLPRSQSQPPFYTAKVDGMLSSGWRSFIMRGSDKDTACLV